MSLKSRFRNIAAAFLMVVSTVAPMGNGLLLNAYAEGIEDAPAHSKKLTPNDDGTYNLSLSVTGATQSSQTSEATKANVILVLDTSSSMNQNAGDVYYPVVGTPGDPANDGNSRPTYYRLNGNRYEQVYYRNGQWRTSDSNNGQTFSGQFYCRSRLWAEKNTLTKADGIIDELLKQNVPGDTVKSDIIEVAVVGFGMNGEEKQSFTTNAATLKNSINALTTDSGTNWEKALQVAKTMADAKKTAQPNEDVYVVFLTDGQPSVTATSSTIASNTTGWNNAWTAASDDARVLITSGYKFYSLFTWGDSTYEHYLTSLVNYAYSGSGNYNSGIGSYGEYYTNADSTDALIEALNQIVHNITNSVGYTDVELIDEVTEMTSTSLSSAIDGTATGFKYTRSGGIYGSGQEWADAPEAKIIDGKVHWDLGDMILENGVTYTVSFTVWPSQESFDLVADLNNGITKYEDLTDDQQKQIIKIGNNYYLKTNTDYPTISYSTITTTTVDGQSSTKITPHDPINITNPDPVDLAEKKITLEKLWEDSLDPSQRDEVCNKEGVCEVVLDLKRDSKPYLTGIKLNKDNGWELEKYLAIAPGVMVSEGHAAYSTSHPIVTIDGVKYAILETGHEYEFVENGINNHFELTHYKYHPMLVNGVLKNVTFTKNGDTITGVESIEDMSSISATNTLKGGINIQKQVVDEEGHAVAANEVSEKFNIKAHLVDSDGKAYSYDYRIYCTTAHDNCTEEVKDDTGAVTGYRSEHIYGSGLIDINIYAQDTIRIVNVHNGTLFYVEEDNIPTGYEQSGISYQISNGSTSNYHNYENTTELNGKIYYAIAGNAAAMATITNKYTSGTLKISKTVNVSNGLSESVENAAKNKEFKFTFRLYTDSTKTKEITGISYNYTGSKSGKIASGESVNLKHDEYIEIAKLPEGAYYEVTEEAAAGFRTEKTGDTGTIESKKTKTAEFTNNYSTSGKVTIKAKKDLQGRDWLANEKFTFTLTGNGENQTKAIGKDEIAEFEIQLTKDGTFTYVISEDTTNLSGGLAKTSADVNVVVVATDNGNGALTFTVTYPSQQTEAIVVNTYSSTGTAELAASKILTGRDWQAGEKYTFSMFDDKDNLLDEVEVDSDGEYTFDKITYKTEDAGKTFVYFIRETSTLPGGMSNSGEIKATVTVKDNNDGTLTTTVVYDNDNNTIINTYTASGEIVLEATKVLTGRKWLNNESYNFVLRDSNQTVLDTEAVDDNETVKFDKITYTEKDAGKTYTYTITEEGTLPGGLTQSGKITATVSVTDGGNGKLNVSVQYDNKDTITNTYKATGKTNLTAKKILDGRDWQEDESYVFALIDSEGNVVERQTVDANETVSFAALNYTEADAGKTYTYTISEVSDLPGGLAKSDDIQVTIEVVDNGDGSVTANVTYTQNDTITNTYSANGSIVLEATKELTGRDWMENEQYTFTLKNSDGEVIDEQIVDENETVSFDEINYTKAGTYHYTIEETSKLPDGVESSGPINVTVEVTDNFDGTLTAVATYGENNENTITNSYTAKGDIELKATKKLEGRAWLENESFDFELFDETGKSLDKQTVTENNPIATFKKLNFTEADAGKTYTYTIKETSKLPGGLKKSDDITVTVTIEDNKNGSLAVTADYTNDGIITNTYKATGGIDLKAEKELIGRDWLDGESYNFVLKDSSGKTLSTKAVDGNKTVTFDTLSYTEADAGKTYTYTISEEGTLKAGVTKSGDITVTVDIKDNGDGTLDVSAQYTNNGKIINTYTAKPTSTTLHIDKEIIDQTNSQKDGSFTFELKDSEGKVVDVKTVTTNGLHGGVDFNVLEFTEAGDYNYTVTEVNGDQAGFTYDTEAHAIVITVADNYETAQLEAKVEIGGKETTTLTITNIYSAKPTEYMPQATKVLLGRELKDKEFAFVVLLNGEQVATGHNDAKGIITFDNAIAFTKAGTYTITIKELKGNLKNVTYDETEFEFTITVTDNDEGELVAEADDAADDIVFVNKYYDGRGSTPPSTPNTYDGGISSHIALFLMSLAGLVGSIFIAKRKSNDEE